MTNDILKSNTILYNLEYHWSSLWCNNLLDVISKVAMFCSSHNFCTASPSGDILTHTPYPYSSLNPNKSLHASQCDSSLLPYPLPTKYSLNSHHYFQEPQYPSLPAIMSLRAYTWDFTQSRALSSWQMSSTWILVVYCMYTLIFWPPDKAHCLINSTEREISGKAPSWSWNWGHWNNQSF